jgi:hypothetical protein
MKPLIFAVVVGAAVTAAAVAADAQSISVEAPATVEAESLPRLPNVFRDCWEPVPAHCVRPPGLLWFGSTATLARERRVFPHRRVHAAAGPR